MVEQQDWLMFPDFSVSLGVCVSEGDIVLARPLTKNAFASLVRYSFFYTTLNPFALLAADPETVRFLGNDGTKILNGSRTTRCAVPKASCKGQTRCIV